MLIIFIAHYMHLHNIKLPSPSNQWAAEHKNSVRSVFVWGSSFCFSLSAVERSQAKGKRQNRKTKHELNAKFAVMRH